MELVRFISRERSAPKKAMQQSLGEIIRHLRRQHRLTQRELAGGRFSKAYVSAVEHNRITPSPGALRFLAERLGQPDGDFAALREQVAAVEPLSVLQTAPALAENNGQSNRDGTFSLLKTLLEQTDLARFSPSHDLPVLAPEVLASLPPPLQAQYFFLLGRTAKEQRNLPLALRAFESALALASAQQQAVILDEIGTLYVLMHASFIALGYHLHARHLLSQASPLSPHSTSPSLRFAVELHCGEAYRHLGAYHSALEHYEQARVYLSAHHDLATVAHLYSGLGYCTYAVLYPATVLSVYSVPRIQAKAEPPEQIEHDFQTALSFLLQSRNFYQVAGDRLQEANVRLMQAALLIDMSTWRRRLAQQSGRKTEQEEALTRCLALLDDAAEHSRQVLLGWQDSGEDKVPPELDTMLYVAFTSLIRLSLERAKLARLEESILDVAYRQRAFAAYLCQQVLETLSIPSLPWAVIRQAVSLSADTLTYRSPMLPRFAELPTNFGETFPHSLQSMVEVYFAAGEVAEELGRATPLPTYAHDCYVQANQYFQAALSLPHSDLFREQHDPGYLIRLYLRCSALREERAFASPALYEQTTKALQGDLFTGLAHLQSLILDKNTEPPQEHGEPASE